MFSVFKIFNFLVANHIFLFFCSRENSALVLKFVFLSLIFFTNIQPGLWKRQLLHFIRITKKMDPNNQLCTVWLLELVGKEKKLKTRTFDWTVPITILWDRQVHFPTTKCKIQSSDYLFPTFSQPPNTESK